MSDDDRRPGERPDGAEAPRADRPDDDAPPARDPGAPRPDATRDAPADPERREVVSWLWRLPVLLAVGGGSWGLYEAIRTHFFKRRPDPTPVFEDGPRVRIAPVDAFAEAWDHVEFVYEDEPAVALRLPGPIPGGIDADGAHLAAFSRVCTHEGCLVDLNRDEEAIAFAFNYRAEGPQLVCPCHLSVFDPGRAGRAVSGPAVTPLPRLRLVAEDGGLVATGRERVTGA